ncbi:MAG: DNA internalization-related competence protein ComEC/Rec2 [Chloroflexi bacterium]|nr:MAG: DNA internalization-related competence protein ComEC/Rec2 [Chloroflexota bacterium]
MPVRLVYLCICWFGGIFFASQINWSASIWLGMATAVFILGFILHRWFQGAWLLLSLGVLGLGGVRYTISLPIIDENHVAFYNDTGTVVGLIGIVTDEPDVRDTSVNLRVSVEHITFHDGRSQPVSGTVLAITDRFPVIPYGTKVAINGDLVTPPEDDDFSYKDYLARQGVHSIVLLAQVDVLAENAGQPLYHTIFRLKQRAKATINQLIPDPEAALLTGILLGDDNGIPPDLAEDFRVTGMTHIIAISGFNIAIIIVILVGITDPFMARKTAVLVAIVGIILYTILVGADASVVRAAIMGSIFLLTSRWLGRPNFAYASLFFTGLCMTMVNPHTLWDVGFQLSFAATLGLMLYADPFTQWTRKHLSRVMERNLTNQVMSILSEAVLLTLAAQILTLPLMIGYFGQLSLISLISNAFILPIQSGVMLWGGLATILGMIWQPLGQPFAWIAWLFLTATINMVRAFARVPWASLPVSVSPSGIAILFAAILGVTWYARQTKERRNVVIDVLKQNLGQKTAVFASIIALLLVFNWSSSQPDGLLHVAFLDVGQGDAIFIQTPTGRQILVDGGFYPSVLNEQLGRQIPFWDHHLDILIATHPDADHVAGLVEVFDRYTIDHLITNDAEQGSSDIYDALLQAAQETNTKRHITQAGEIIDIGDGVRLEILHPGPHFATLDRNENSVSFRLTYGDFSLLLTGDVEEEGEQTMLAQSYPLQSLVFKAGHHGSKTSSTMPFLEAVRPQIIIISAGEDNRFNHPHPEVLARAQAIGAAVLGTYELGTIEVTTDGQTMWWQAGPP